MAIKKKRTIGAPLAIIFGCLAGLSGCHSASTDRVDPIVGTWVVKIPGAPFPYQMYIFHADGTVLESNPDAGDAATSDSALMGAWARHGNRITAKLIEVAADRRTHSFASRGDIAFDITVQGDTITGSANANFYDANEKLVHGPVRVSLAGKRVLSP